MSEFADYEAHGWRLCLIERGHKAPQYTGWNTKPMDAADIETLGGGAGLLHVQSGTCALDIDNMELARPWLRDRGAVDIDTLLRAPDAVRIESGRPGRSKLLYRLSRPLRTVKPRASGVELRCATAAGLSMQDVLPPTIHPDTKRPYRWAYGDELLGSWRVLPPIPSVLLALWRELAASEPAAPSMAEAKGDRPLVVPAGTDPRTLLAQLQRWIDAKDPNCEHDEWLKVGAKLHDATGGSEEGLELWDRWSAKATRIGSNGKPVYWGSQHIRTRYLSFSSAPGKHIATLAHELPASAEEFPIVTEADAAPDQQSTEQLLKQTARQLRQSALTRLEQRLVYVYSAERYFDTERHRVISSDSAIEHMFTALMPAGRGGARMSPVKLLKESQTKRFVDGLGFHPGEGVLFTDGNKQFANLYRPELAEPLEPTPAELDKINWLFGRIDDYDYGTWLQAFFGYAVQHPGIKIKSAPLIWSETQGNGKTTLLRTVPSLLTGPQYSREVTCALLNSDFNDYLLNAWHINLTEFRAGSRGERSAISSKLKAWITDDSIAVHPKGLTAYTMPNHFFVTATSNEDDAAMMDNNDRRWGVHEMHAKQFTESEQRWIYNEFLLTPRAAGVLRHYFLNLDVSDFSPSARAPDTAARREMVAASASSDIECMTLAFEERRGPFERDIVLTHDVLTFVHKNSFAKPSAHRIGKLLCRDPFNGKAIQFRVGERTYRGVVLRNREQWIGAAGKEIMTHISGEDVDLFV